jgi:hypothetical protein
MKETPPNVSHNATSVPPNVVNVDSTGKPSSSFEDTDTKTPWPLIAGILITVGLATWYFAFNPNKENVTSESINETVKTEPVKLKEISTQEKQPDTQDSNALNNELLPVDVDLETPQSIEPPVAKIVLPGLNQSDELIKSRLPSLTWRTELLKLVIDDDMIRRIVVFTDNFSQGNVAYSHSPLVSPQNKFSMDDADAVQVNSDNAQQNSWLLENNQSKRFSVYIDLIRSLDQEALLQAYKDFKPLFDEAYSELGYEGDFTEVMQEAINRVLDIELPDESVVIIRPSVMYKFQDKKIEDLPDADKLLLRLGRDNLLAIKTVLLDLNETLEQ